MVLILTPPVAALRSLHLLWITARIVFLLKISCHVCEDLTPEISSESQRPLGEIPPSNLAISQLVDVDMRRLWKSKARPSNNTKNTTFSVALRQEATDRPNGTKTCNNSSTDSFSSFFLRIFAFNSFFTLQYRKQKRSQVSWGDSAKYIFHITHFMKSDFRITCCFNLIASFIVFGAFILPYFHLTFLRLSARRNSLTTNSNDVV